jgi:hypothetical protein
VLAPLSSHIHPSPPYLWYLSFYLHLSFSSFPLSLSFSFLPPPESREGSEQVSFNCYISPLAQGLIFEPLDEGGVGWAWGGGGWGV